jgi:hypothetical protein
MLVLSAARKAASEQMPVYVLSSNLATYNHRVAASAVVRDSLKSDTLSTTNPGKVGFLFRRGQPSAASALRLPTDSLDRLAIRVRVWSDAGTAHRRNHNLSHVPDRVCS